ncbi:hypothetical protein Pmani_023717 [Petrolisthes manimaculis]|uniref:CRAL-TRIO domain-containing protein n=1 Tax=Petrolisthes manimaculis TaxID=1843537 RepID=A0AAE1U0T7_9EUCA|nr:hypothetical protein Pmani_023717 [Petrolisthes manimaculis]
MRGETSEAIIGGGVGVRDEAGGVKGSASPPLSAAVSQVSLAPSNLTTSDPDLATSSAASSRPPSSSQMSATTSPEHTPFSSRPPSSSGMVAPELALPAPEDYTTETVEFPTSPRAMKADSKRSAGVCFVESDELQSASPNLLTPNYKPDELEESDNTPKQGNAFEVGSDIEEDYFEEYHLPNSHENAFVRHKSYRRKVHLTPIDAPDAEKIEGLVRTGEFHRHGSIRRKIVPEEASSTLEGQHENCDSKFDTNRNIQGIGGDASTEVIGTFAKDLQEIEHMLDNSEDLQDVSEIMDEAEMASNNLRNLANNGSSDELLKQTNTSTPKSESTKNSSNSAMNDMSFSLTEENCNEESLSIEQSTLIKVRECMDFTKYKDIYNLSGRLQDILSPKEIEEVLNNSEKYSEYVNKDVIEALHNSLQEHQNSIIGQTDSGISSPKKVISAEGLDLDSAVKDEIRAVIDESLPLENECSNSSKRSSSIFTEDDDEEDERGFRFERRSSFRMSKEGNKVLEVEGVFIESKSDDIGLKKIKAPTLDLSANTSEEIPEDIDLTREATVALPPTPEKESVSPESDPINKIDSDVAAPPPAVPDIIITGTGDDEDDDDDDNNRDELSVSKLLIDSGDMSEVTNCTDVSGTTCDQFDTSPEEDKPKTLDLEGVYLRKRISVAEDILRSPVDDDSISVASVFSQRSDGEDEDDDDDIDDVEVEGLDLRNLDTSVPADLKFNPEVELLPPPPPQMIPELTALEESTEERHWRSVVIGGVWHRIDMKVIAPYRKCVSHGGYLGEKRNAVIVISACQLPDRSRRDYNYVMDNLFLYVLSTLEQLIAEDYILVYLAGGTPRSSMPSFHWLKRAYQMIDRKLRKNLKTLHVVHPTFWVRTVVAFSRPFISTKFYRKLKFVDNLTELAQMVPLDQLDIPDAVKQADFELMIREKKKNLGKRRSYSLATR